MTTIFNFKNSNSTIKSPALLVGMLAVGLLSGCASTKEMAQSIEKETGVKVVLEADDSDTCLHDQIEALLKQYQSLSAHEQANTKSMLQHYNRLILKTTEVAGGKQGQDSILNLVAGDCNTNGRVRPGGASNSTSEDTYIPQPGDTCERDENNRCHRDIRSPGNCRNYRDDYKSIEQSITETGHKPQVRVSRGNDLIIQVEKSVTHTATRYFLTNDTTLFARIQSVTDPAFETAMRYGQVTLRNTSFQNSESCAPRIGLGQLLRF